MVIGRNDPCSCGSGLKFKKCCLSKQDPTTDDLFRRRLQVSRNELVHKIIKHAKKTYDDIAIHEAWHEFHMWNEDELDFDPNSIELPAFMPWFFYVWRPADNPDINPAAPRDLSPAESLLTSKSSQLEPLQVQYIKECTSKGFTFIELLEVWPGRGFKAIDVLRGEVYDFITEKLGSEKAKPHDLMFAQVVTINGLHTIEASSSFVIEPIFKPEIISLRQGLQEMHGTITHDVLRESSLDVVGMYQHIRSVLFNPRPRVLTNTDGHKYVPHKLVYEIDSPAAAFEALHHLCVAQTRAETLELAELASDGSVQKINFPWLKLGNSQNQGWENTVLGHIDINGKTMTIDVNSAERAELIEEEIKKRLSNGCKLISKSIEPLRTTGLVEDDSDNSDETDDTDDTDDRDDRDADSLGDGENLADDSARMSMLMEMNRRHWEGWIHSKIPVLQGKTPLESMQTADGREALDALITYFERGAKAGQVPGQTPEMFQDLRARLGL